MSNVGRNDPCPCGSGKKFKRCCLGRIEEQARLERARVEQELASAEIERLERVRKRAEATLAEAQATSAAFEEMERLSADVLRLIEAKQFDEAESAARQLEAGFPDDTLGIERLGQVYEARGMAPEAGEHYRRVVAVMDDLGDGNFCHCCRARLVKAVRRVDPNGPALVLGRDPQ
jgi:tetratricopeptide (TPR) repeat protein